MKDLINLPALAAALIVAFGRGLLHLAGQAWTWLLGRFLTTVVVEADTPLYAWAEDWLAAHPSARACPRFVAHLSEHLDPSLPPENLVYRTENDNRCIQTLVSVTGHSVGLRPVPSAQLFRHDGKLIYVRRTENGGGGGGGGAKGNGSAVPGYSGDPFSNDAPPVAPNGRQPGASLPALEIAVVGRGPEAARHLLEGIARERGVERRSSRRADVFVAHQGNWRRLLRRPMRPAESVVLPDNIMADMVDDAARFRAGEAHYRHLGIPWRRGILLEGLPGTGKTSAIQAVASELGLDLYVVHLSSIFADDQLTNLMLEASPDAILLFEDVDAAWRKRHVAKKYNQYVEKHFSSREAAKSHLADPETGERDGHGGELVGITLSGLLNVLDGVIAPEGRLTFLTTNYVERLPTRLLRPGRIDKRVTFGAATEAQVLRMWERFFPDCPGQYAAEFVGEVLRPVVGDPPLVMAQVQQYLLLHLDSWEAAHAGRDRFHEITRPVEGTEE